MVVIYGCFVLSLLTLLIAQCRSDRSALCAVTVRVVEIIVANRQSVSKAELYSYFD